MNIFKQLIATTILFATFVVVPSNAFAQEKQVCVSQYGGGVVCGVSNPPAPHVPVQSGFADFINPLTLGILSISASGVFYLRSKRSARI